MFRLKYRRRLRVGVKWLNATANVSQGRWTSTTYRVGPFSWNSRRTGAGVDLPGGFSADLGERKRRH